MGDRAVETVEALVEIGRRVDGIRLGQDIRNGAFVVFSVETPEIPSGHWRQAHVRRNGVVLGAVIHHTFGGSGRAEQGAAILIHESVGRRLELETI